jgi:chromosome segregation ATPase
MINRWEVVGRRKSGKKHKRVYGWRHYPEHIAPRDEAQKQAKNAEAEGQTFEQWGHQAQLEANELNKQATALSERLTDWPELKRGIEYEINAKEQQLQAEKDLVALQTPVQQQQLETMELKISQSEAELAKLEAEELSEQKQRTDATQERLNKVQGEVEVNWGESAMATRDLQDFLETYGYLLPYQERRAAVQKQIRQLEIEKAETQELLLEIRNAIASDPNNSDLASQLEPTKNHLQDIEQRLAYAKAQEEQLNLSAPDSPQRLAIGNLIADLAERLQRSPDTNTLPLQKYIDFLRGVESRSNNLLNGFDDLEERLKVAETEQTAADETLKRLQDEYRDLGLAKAALETEKSVDSHIEAFQKEIAPQQEILDGYQQQITDAHGVASNFEELRKQYQDNADWWNSQTSVFNEGSYLTHNPDVANAVRRGWRSAGYHYAKYGRREGRLPNPQAQIERDLAQAAANNAATQRDAATLQAQQLEASLQSNIYAAQTTLAAIESKQQIFTDIENIQPNATLEEAIALKESQIGSTKTAISQVQDTIQALENNLTATKKVKSDKEAEISGQEGAISQTESDIAAMPGKIAAKQAEITEKQSVLQGYNNQINEANVVTNNFEQQRLQHEANANSWNEKINTWGVTGHRTESYRYKSGKRRKTGYRQVPVYGWVYDPQAEANRDAQLAAANNATQQRDLATQQAQELTTTLQPQIEATETNIAELQTDKQNLDSEKQNLEGQLGKQRQGLENLQSELGEIEQNIANIESDIAANEQTEAELDAQLLKESSEKIYLQETLAEIDKGIGEKESEISDKYEEIELTEKYARQVATEADRLSDRVNLLNEGDALEADYRAQEDRWAEAIATQVAATNQLLAARKAGEEERKQLLSFQSELTETKNELATAQQQQESLETAVTDTQQNLEFTKVQLVTQELSLQSLQAQEEPLRSAEAYFYQKAQESREKIWHWDGRKYSYNEERAEEYRTYLQGTSRLAKQRNDLWPKIEETQKKIEELQQGIATKQTDLATKQSELGTATTQIANLTAKVGEIEGDIAPLVTALEPLQQEEARKLQEFQTAVRAAETVAQQLATTTKNQANALKRLIGFGVLGTESDIDFFPTQVEAKVEGFIEELQDRSSELAAEANNLNVLMADWEQDLEKTTDDVSRQALTELIAQTTAQRDDLLARKGENDGVVTDLSDRLTVAKASLQNLLQQQELEIREQINSNDERLEALNRQLETETAAEKAVNEDTVLSYAQLNDQVRSDLTASATQWVNQLLEGHQQTKEIGESQQNLSHSVDELIEYIEDNLADVDGERDRNLANLRDVITTLGVVAPLRDELATGETTLKEEIEKLKQWIEQDAKLWSEIAPIAERFGAESKELAEYQPQSELIGEAREIIEPFFEIQRQKEKRWKLSEDYDYFENPDNGSRYFFTGSKTWHAAQEEAEKVGGNLVTIRNQQEQDFLSKKVGGKRVWIGFNDAEREGDWRWVSGEPITYRNFKRGEPNNSKGREDFAEIRGDRSGKWNDSKHYDPRPGLVEVTVKDLEQQQQEILDNLVKWAEENNALDQISDIARQILDDSQEKELESLNHRLTDYDRFNTEKLPELTGGAREIVEPFLEIERQKKLLEDYDYFENPDNGSRYFFTGSKTWDAAQEEAGKVGGNLATIRNQEEQDFLSQKVGDQRVWIGLNDVEREGDWRWVSGEPVTYTNFQHGQPDNAKGREDFVELRGNVSGKWNDHESPKYKKRGLVEVKIKELEEQQRAILENLVKWAVENNALDQISDIIPYDNERLESLSDHLAEYNRLKTEQQVESAKATELRQGWEEAVNFEPEKIVRTEFNNKLVESVRADDNYTYNRYSNDGGKTWSNWQNNNSNSKADDIKFTEVDGKLYQVMRRTNNHVYVRNSDNGADWSGWSDIGAGPTSGEFAIDAIGDRLVVSVRHANNKIYTRGINSKNWQPWNHTEVQTIGEFSQKIIDNRLVQSYKGIDNRTYVRNSLDGLEWAQWSTIETAEEQSEWREEYLAGVSQRSFVDKPENISEVEFGDKTVQSMTADNKEVYTRHSTDGGETWTEWKHTGGHANSNVKQLTLNDKVFQVIKGTNDAVFIRNSSDGENWTGWGKLSGAIVGDFQVEAIADKLVLSIRGTDNKIYTRHATNGTSWSGWHTANVRALTGIRQEVVKDKLVQSYRGTDDNIYTRHSGDGKSWTVWDTLPQAIASSDWRQEYLQQLADSSSHKVELEGISGIEFGDKILQSRTAENKEVQTRHSTDGGRTWTQWKHTGDHANSNVKQLLLNNKVYQVVKGTDNGVHIRNSTNGESWTGWGNLSGAVVGDFQIEAIANKLVLATRGMDNKIRSRYATNNTSGNVWSGWHTASVPALNPVHQELVDDKLVQSYRGLDGEIYTRYSSDGSNWREWETLSEAIASSDWREEYLQQLGDSSIHKEPENISEIELGNKIVQSRTAENKEVQTRHSTDGGKTWTQWKHTGGHGNSNVKQLILNGKLFQVMKGTNDAVYIRNSADGEKWTGWGKLSDAILGDFQVEAMEDRLVLSIRNTDNKIYTRQATNGTSWSGWEAAPTKTLEDFSQKVMDGKLVQSYCSRGSC